MEREEEEEVEASPGSGLGNACSSKSVLHTAHLFCLCFIEISTHS